MPENPARLDLPFEAIFEKPAFGKMVSDYLVGQPGVDRLANTRSSGASK